MVIAFVSLINALFYLHFADYNFCLLFYVFFSGAERLMHLVIDRCYYFFECLFLRGGQKSFLPLFSKSNVKKWYMRQINVYHDTIFRAPFIV